MKALKVIVSILGVLAVLFVVAVVAIFTMLPTPGQIGRQIFSPKTAPKNSAPADAAAPSVEKEPASPAEAPQQEEADATEDHSNISIKNENGQRIMAEIMDERKPLTEFCTLLGRPSSASRVLEPREFGEKVIDQFQNGASDPAMEAFMPVLRQFFRYDETRDLVKMVEDAQRSGDEGFIKKAHFYAGLARVYTKLNSSMKDFNDIGDRTYHLMMLARIADRRPELARDRAVGDYCRGIENALNSREAFGGDAERKAFQDFLAQSGVSAKEIGYDPNYRTKMGFERGEGSLRLHGGWIDSWIDSKPKTQEVR